MGIKLEKKHAENELFQYIDIENIPNPQKTQAIQWFDDLFQLNIFESLKNNLMKKRAFLMMDLTTPEMKQKEDMGN